MFLGEDRIVVRFESAIRNDQSGITGVFAQLDLHDIILGQVISRSGELGNFRERFGERHDGTCTRRG